MGTVLHRYLFLEGEAWNPAEMSNLVLFLHAPWEGGNEPSSLSSYSQNPSIAAGDPVTTATDWSNTEHPTQATASKKPTWEAAKVGGKHAFEFDGVDDNWISNITTTEDVWVAMVMERAGTTTTHVMQAGMDVGGSPDWAGWWIYAPSATHALTRVADAAGALAYHFGVWAISRPPARINATLASAGADQSLFENDVELTTGTAIGTGIVCALESRPFTIGGRWATGGFDGTIASLLVFAGKPGAADMALVNDWLDAEYSL